MRRILVLFVVAGCHHGPAPAPTPTTGAVGGFVRDRETGEPLDAKLGIIEAETFKSHGARTAADGSYLITDLPPGRYDLIVAVPGASLRFTGVPVTAGHTTGFDVPFDPKLEVGGPITYGSVETDDITRYQPDHLREGTARLEGVVTDTVTRERVAGEVIVAQSESLEEPVTVVSDDHGRYAMPDLPPGRYDLSAYYSVARRGQIEVRRDAIDIAAGEAVYVPIYVELSGTQ